MSNDNKTRLKVNHSQHSDNQQPKRKRSLIGFMSIIACLIMLLLVTSCQPTDHKIFVIKEVVK